MNDTIMIYKIETFEGNGDYMPFVIAMEKGKQIDILNSGDNIHNDGYNEFYDGYVKAVKKFSSNMQVKEKYVSIESYQDITKYEHFLRKADMIGEFIDEIENDIEYKKYLQTQE